MWTEFLVGTRHETQLPSMRLAKLMGVLCRRCMGQVGASDERALAGKSIS